MTCRRCRKKIENFESKCPHCGDVNDKASGMFQTSTVLISTRSTDQVFRSVDEVPAGLRTRLLKSTNGANSATILIADRQGREELAKAIRNLPVSSSDRPDESKRPERPKPTFPQIAGLLALLMAAALIWLLFR